MKPRKVTIVLTDDDPDDREIFAEAVAEVDSSIECVLTKNGKELFQLLNDHPAPEYIFLDLNMPGMSGLECLIELKKSKGLKDIPVIIYTTSKDARQEEEAKRAGASHFITKPDSFNEICKTISNVLGDLTATGN